MAALACLSLPAPAADATDPETRFDGAPWHISSGNLSVSFIQASPIGAYPKTNFFEPPPSLESQVRLKKLGLTAMEDYVAWGAVERIPGEWSWDQHDAVEKRLHEAGLKYVVYNWTHFPPAWLREQKGKRTLMRCVEHGQETYYLSIFDPRTLDWYDHFYKNLSEHFGDRIDDVYACVLGPYGEGNYPLRVPDFVNMGHCHEGYWCGDEFALRAFEQAMQRKYVRVARLNAAWGVQLRTFAEVRPPREISTDKFKPSLAAFPKAADKRRWLDFITWYHQALIDFAGESLRTVEKHFPAEKIRLKPGGNYGSVNPLAWGTYCPGYAKMARGSGVVLQPADCQGAIFGDKWMGTAYQFYVVKECTEQAGNLNDTAFAQRMFSDASCGASQMFTYDYERHGANVRKYIHLYTGKPGDTEIAVHCPTTLYRLGVNLHPLIVASYPLRDLCEYDVLDELLIADGALARRYKTLLLLQPDIIDQPILDKIDAFRRAGGKLIVAGTNAIVNVEGEIWPQAARLTRIAPLNEPARWTQELAQLLPRYKGFEGRLDSLWTSRRAGETFVFNATNRPMETTINGAEVTVAPHSIYSSAANRRTTP